MLNVEIVCVGKLTEKFWTDACAEYAKRLKGFCSFRIVEVDEEKMADNVSPSAIRHTLQKEGERILSVIPKDAVITAMCIEGKHLSSEALAKQLEEFALRGDSRLAFVIGGSWGLSDEVKNAAGLKLSMSDMTFPHQLARVMLCEQLYRAFSIRLGSKYHK